MVLREGLQLIMNRLIFVLTNTEIEIGNQYILIFMGIIKLKFQYVQFPFHPCWKRFLPKFSGVSFKLNYCRMLIRTNGIKSQ